MSRWWRSHDAGWFCSSGFVFQGIIALAMNKTLSCRREPGKEPRRGNTFPDPCRTAMAYDDSKKKEDSDQIDDVGLAAGRAQREKKRSYKDLLREEEEIAAQVRKNAKNRLKDSNVFLLGTESDKKRKHSSSKHCYRG